MCVAYKTEMAFASAHSAHSAHSARGAGALLGREHFCLDLHVPPERALRILLAGAKAAKGPLKDPAPKVRITGMSKWGVEYEIRCWLNPADVSPSKGWHAVSTSVLDHLHHAELTLACEKQDPMPQCQLDTHADKVTLLSRIELFEKLEREELEQLSNALSECTICERKNVVTQGEDGTNMFLLVEGLLHVLAKANDDEEVLVGAITPGQFFGEMSLLTGEPRSATVQAGTDCVMYEITKENLEPLLVKRPEIAEQMTSLVAERRTRMKAKQAEKRGEDVNEEDVKGLADQLLGKMRTLLGLQKNRPLLTRVTLS
ncbi:MAG: cyclic nucleotide-binding domain-containing protein [Deltaproteobacteria bacterium]|nr:cyclic nucleotide-binding domain-containing protein [Deltaproteobacteria bacterium]